MLFPTDPLPETNRKRDGGYPFTVVANSQLRFWFMGEDYGKAGRLREQTPLNARPPVGRSHTAGLSAGPIRSGDLLAHYDTTSD